MLIPEDAMTIKEVAAEVKRSPDAVRMWIGSGVKIGRTRVRLAATRVGGRILVSREAVRDFIAACNPGATAPTETASARARRFEAEKARVLEKHFGVKRAVPSKDKRASPDT